MAEFAAAAHAAQITSDLSAQIRNGSDSYELSGGKFIGGRDTTP